MAARHSSTTAVILAMNKLFGESFVCILLQKRCVRHWQRFIVCINCMPASLFLSLAFHCQ